MPGKYDNCFLTYEGKQEFPLGKIIQRFSSNNVPGSHFYFLHWIMPNDYSAAEFQVGHPPHTHEEPEILFHIGIDPAHPEDLGAEIEFTIGEEMEIHVVNKSTAIFIPAGVPHSPWRMRRVDRPFIFLEVNQAEKHTNTWRAELLPKEERDKIDWSMWKGGERF
jgi:hypothetical protein